MVYSLNMFEEYNLWTKIILLRCKNPNSFLWRYLFLYAVTTILSWKTPIKNANDSSKENRSLVEPRDRKHQAVEMAETNFRCQCNWVAQTDDIQLCVTQWFMLEKYRHKLLNGSKQLTSSIIAQIFHVESDNHQFKSQTGMYSTRRELYPFIKKPLLRDSKIRYSMSVMAYLKWQQPNLAMVPFGPAINQRLSSQ